MMTEIKASSSPFLQHFLQRLARTDLFDADFSRQLHLAVNGSSYHPMNVLC